MLAIEQISLSAYLLDNKDTNKKKFDKPHVFSVLTFIKAYEKIHGDLNT
jgi:hypothetical protein